MNDLSDNIILTTLAVFLGAVIGLFVRAIYISKDKASMPTEDEIHKLFSKINEWKMQKASYSEMVTYLKRMGYRKNVADIILGEMERRQRS